MNPPSVNDCALILLAIFKFVADNPSYTILLFNVNESAVILPTTTIDEAFNEDVVILLLTVRFCVSISVSAVILPDTTIEAEFNEDVVILLLTRRFCVSNSEYIILLVSVNESAVILPDTTNEDEFIESAINEYEFNEYEFNEYVVILLLTLRFCTSNSE